MPIDLTAKLDAETKRAQGIAAGVNVGGNPGSRQIAPLSSIGAGVDFKPGTTAKPTTLSSVGQSIGSGLAKAGGAVLDTIIPSAGAAEMPPSLSAGGSISSLSPTNPKAPASITPLSAMGPTTTPDISTPAIAAGIRSFSMPGGQKMITNQPDDASSIADIGKLKPRQVYGSTDLGEVNQINARANAARGEMIDSMRGNSGIIQDTGRAASDATMDKWGREHAYQQSLQAMSANPRMAPAIGQAFAAQTQADASMHNQGIAAGIAFDRNGVAMRGQDIGAQTKARGQDIAAGVSFDRNAVTMRGQDIQAGTAANRNASNEAIAEARIKERNGISLSQQRGNAEIDAARQVVSGLSAEDIKRRTQKFTATGRENPDFDATLERAAALANRRKYGTDEAFDQRQQAPQQPQGDEGDVANRFKGDTSMKGRTLGKRTDKGVEVFESGRLVGYYN